MSKSKKAIIIGCILGATVGLSIAAVFGSTTEYRCAAYDKSRSYSETAHQVILKDGLFGFEYTDTINNAEILFQSGTLSSLSNAYKLKGSETKDGLFFKHTEPGKTPIFRHIRPNNWTIEIDRCTKR